jgi:hypothetical protein
MKQQLISISTSDRIIIHSSISQTVIDSFSAKSTSGTGITFDSYNVLSVDTSTDKVYFHSGHSNEVLTSFTTRTASPSDISFVNGNIFISGSTAPGKIFKYSGFSDTVIGSFSTPGSPGTPEGISFDGINILISDSNRDKVYKMSSVEISKDVILDSFTSTNPIGLTTINGNDTLIFNSSIAKFIRFSGFNHNIIDSFSYVGSSNFAQGIAIETTISSSDCIKLNNGDLLISYNSGQGGATYDAVSRRFDISANTWTTAVTVDASNTGYTHPAILQLSSTSAFANRILFIHRDKAASTLNVYASDDNAVSYFLLTTIANIDLDENNRISLIQSGSKIVVSYHRGRRSFTRISTDDGKTWGSENTLTTDGIYPDLSLLSSGSFVASYEKYDITNNLFGRVYINSSVDGATWREQAANILTASDERYTRPSITIDEEDNSLYVVTQDIVSKDLRLSRSADDGLTWSSVENVNPFSIADNRQSNKVTSPFNFGLFSPTICKFHEKLLVLSEAWDGTNGHITAIKRNTWRNVTESLVSENAYYPVFGTPDKVSWDVLNNDGSATISEGVLTLTTSSGSESQSYKYDIPENKRITDGFKCKFTVEIDVGGTTTAKDVFFRFIVNGNTTSADIEIRFATTGLQVFDNNAGADVSGGSLTHTLTTDHEFLISIQSSVVSLWFRNSHDREIEWTNILSNKSINTSSGSRETNFLYSSDSTAARIYQHSRFSSTILNSISAPSTVTEGISFDQDELLSIDRNVDRILKHSGFSNIILNSFSSPSGSAKGISFDGTNILSVDAQTDRIYKHSGFSNIILDSFSSPSGTPTGIFFDGTNILSVDTQTDRIYKHSGFSNIILDSFSTPSIQPQEVAFDGTNVISIDTGTNKIYQHSGFSNVISDSFASPGGQISGVTVKSKPSQIEFGIETNTATFKIHSINYKMDDDGLSDGFTDPDDLIARVFSPNSVSQFLIDGIELISTGSNAIVDDQWTINSAFDFPKESIIDDSPTNEWRSTTDSTAVNIVFDAGTNNTFEVDQINLVNINFRTGSFQMNDTDSWGAPTVDEAFTMSNLVSSTVTSVKETSLTDTAQSLRKNQFALPGRPRFVRMTSGTASGNTYKIIANNSDTFIFDGTTLVTDGVLATDTYVVFGDRITKQITAASHRFLRIVIDSQDTAEGFYRIGKALFEKKLQLSKFASINFTRERIKNTVTNAFDSGQQVVGKKGESREVFTYNFNNKSLTLVQELEEFFDEIGWDENPFVFIHNQESDLQDFILARVVSPFRYNHTIGTIYTLPSLRIVEEL